MAILRFIFYFFLFGNRFTIFGVQTWFYFGLLLLLNYLIRESKIRLSSIYLIPYLVILFSVFMNVYSSLFDEFYILRILSYISYLTCIILIFGFIKWNLVEYKIVLLSVLLLFGISFCDWFLLTTGASSTGLIDYLPSIFTVENDETDYYGFSGLVFYRMNFFFSDPSVGGLVFFTAGLLNEFLCKIKYINILFFIGVILSGSGTVILLLFIFLIVQILRRNISFVFPISLFTLALYSFGFFDFVIDFLRFKFNVDGTVSAHFDTNVYALSHLSFFGNGFLSFDLYYPDVGSTHNSFLGLLFDTGIFGLLSMLLYYFLLADIFSVNKFSLYIIVFLFIASFGHNILLRFEFIFLMLISRNSSKLFLHIDP